MSGGKWAGARRWWKVSQQGPEEGEDAGAVRMGKGKGWGHTGAREGTAAGATVGHLCSLLRRGAAQTRAGRGTRL